jgi:hypothetical protein
VTSTASGETSPSTQAGLTMLAFEVRINGSAAGRNSTLWLFPESVQPGSTATTW